MTMEIFYRLIRNDEDPEKGLFPKDSSSDVSVENHVVYGSHGYCSRFISCCKTMEAVNKFAYNCVTYPKRIVMITKKYPSIRTIDLTDLVNQNTYFPFNQVAKNYANCFKEVLIEGSVPYDCVTLISYNGEPVQ